MTFFGSTDYSKSNNESLITTLGATHKITLFEPSHKNYVIYFSGMISHDYDHFGNTLKINGFSGFGIDF